MFPLLPVTMPASIFVVATAVALGFGPHLLKNLVEGSQRGVKLLPQLFLQAQNQTIQHLDQSLPHLKG